MVKQQKYTTKQSYDNKKEKQDLERTGMQETTETKRERKREIVRKTKWPICRSMFHSRDYSNDNLERKSTHS